jgi:hypothetical protein
MPRSAWCLILPLFLGCAGKNTVAGEEKPKPAQLAASLPSWCEKACQKINGCAANTPCDCMGTDACGCLGVNDGCVDDCQDALRPFTKGDDACAAAGERLKACVDGLSCSDLNSSGGDPCQEARKDIELCPEEDDGNPPSGGPDAMGGSVGGYPATAGSSATAGSATGGFATGGTGTNDPASGGSAVAVSCSASYGAAGADSGGAPSALTCEEGRADCSDGHEYSWLCARGSDQQLGCACFVDKQVVGGFDPKSEACPELSRVNAGCGFGLAH